MDSHFYVDLPSNIHSNNAVNRASSFVTTLPEPITLEGVWEVGLVELQYPRNWANVPKLELAFKIKLTQTALAKANSADLRTGYSMMERRRTHKLFRRKDDVISVYVAKAAYPTLKHLAENINRTIQVAMLDRLAVLLDVNEDIQRISLLKYEGFDSVTIQNCSTTQILGLVKHGDVSEAVVNFDDTVYAYRGEYFPDIDNGLHTLYVYTDIIDTQYTGDCKTQLLRTVPVRGTVGQVTTVIFDKPHYKRVVRKNLQSIEIMIRDRTDSEIAFQRGMTVCKLHFRRVL